MRLASQMDEFLEKPREFPEKKTVLDFYFALRNFLPQILIYHSHSQETFADSREGEESDTIVGVGDYLTQLLTENYGYQVVHLKEQFDMAGGELDRSAAYDYARDYLEPYLQENPDIQPPAMKHCS